MTIDDVRKTKRFEQGLMLWAKRIMQSNPMFDHITKENPMPRAAKWKHKKLYKGKVFFANYEYSKGGKRIVKFKDIVSGKEVGPKEGYKSLEDAVKKNWVKITE